MHGCSADGTFHFHRYGERRATGVDDVVVNPDLVAISVIRRLFEGIAVCGVSQPVDADTHIVHTGLLVSDAVGSLHWRRFCPTGLVRVNLNSGEPGNQDQERQHRRVGANRNDTHCIEIEKKGDVPVYDPGLS